MNNKLFKILFTIFLITAWTCGTIKICSTGVLYGLFVGSIIGIVIIVILKIITEHIDETSNEL